MEGEEEEEEAVTIEEVANEDFKGEPCQEKGDGAKVSALQASQEKAKDLSYYYAHSTEEKAFPADAVIRQEDPLYRSDGLGPHKISTDENSSLARSSEHVRWMETYSFADEGSSVKIYVEFPESIKEANIRCDYSRFGVELLVHQPTPGVVYGVRIRERDGWVLEHERSGGFAHEILPEKSKYRLASSGQRITLTVAKKDEKEKWYELKKKDIKSSMPR
mmetsp:Transcript_2809/g.6575  ORF Transcript_2809/g.6575 Transcript_2809/m.6575 type:complete len:219 (+) Transcript_2809:22-678(+)|eukprot:CAMPEP_0171104540 /NCGR_PEP_ID=MMETSP0766_2-20121228/60853_1 /TAXON_ID=439317 /ORGANISM="Gambierdiscus australes, Strain CAWD 149" /LENGTH=218 /DNA_ID=CAMNT_0011565185 /DNA_START=55 /DNA_END=711 /DNA_ORIENTATION=+